MTGVERDDVESKRKLLERAFGIRLREANAASLDDSADEGCGVGERSGVEGGLVGEDAKAVKDTGDESGERLGAELGGDDLSVDTAKDCDSERDLGVSQAVGADVTESLQELESVKFLGAATKTHLVRRERLRGDQRSRTQDDDSEDVLDHRRQVLANELRLRIDEAEQKREPASQSTQSLGHLLPHNRLLGELTLEKDPIPLGERGDGGLLACESFAELCLPHLDLVLFRVLLRHGGLGLGGSEDCNGEVSVPAALSSRGCDKRTIDECDAFGSGPDAVLGGTDEGKVLD